MLGIMSLARFATSASRFRVPCGSLTQSKALCSGLPTGISGLQSSPPAVSVASSSRQHVKESILTRLGCLQMKSRECSICVALCARVNVFDTGHSTSLSSVHTISASSFVASVIESDCPFPATSSKSGTPHVAPFVPPISTLPATNASTTPLCVGVRPPTRTVVGRGDVPLFSVQTWLSSAKPLGTGQIWNFDQLAGRLPSGVLLCPGSGLGHVSGAQCAPSVTRNTRCVQ